MTCAWKMVQMETQRLPVPRDVAAGGVLQLLRHLAFPDICVCQNSGGLLRFGHFPYIHKYLQYVLPHKRPRYKCRLGAKQPPTRGEAVSLCPRSPRGPSGTSLEQAGAGQGREGPEKADLWAFTIKLQNSFNAATFLMFTKRLITLM